jgi:tripartite-type tricarboxylate transporter receptor subunit TctC
MSIRSLSHIALGAAAALLAASVAAQGYPNKPIRLVVPITPGSGTDIIARTVAPKLSENLGQPIVIENRPGAGATIGTALVAKSPPDGYTFLVQAQGHTVNPAIYANLTYDTVKDFAGVTMVAGMPNVLVVSPTTGFKSLGELLSNAKSNPAQIQYASAGNGTSTHITGEMFKVAASIDVQHIPYKGTPEALVDAMMGRVAYFFAPLVSAVSQIRDGKVRALAVSTARRSSLLPDVPTVAEAGVPGFEYNFWVAFFAPAQTPRDVIERVAKEVAVVVNLPELREQLAKVGAEPFTMTPAALDKYIAEEVANMAKLVKAAGMKVN